MIKLRLFGLALLAVLSMAAVVRAEGITLTGELTQGGFVYGKGPAGASITLDGRDVPLTDDGQFFLAFHYNAAPTAELKVLTKAGEVSTQALKITPRSFNIERINGLPPGKVTAPPERQKRLIKESAIKRAARANKGMQQDWLGGFQSPIDVAYRVSGYYGSQRILNGVPKRPHYGLDFAAPTGTPVKAPAGGTVILAEADFWYEGGLIFIDHGHGLQSAFLHLSDVSVKVGDVVAPGDTIGAVGATGRATGPHLDWRINWGKTWIDPQILMRVKPAPDN